MYQRGLGGNFKDQEVNIEDLLNVLSELNQKHQNKLYPFIGSWNVHLSKVAGKDFEVIKNLKDWIKKQLFKWINVENYDEAFYFKSFGDLSDEIGTSTRVFSLNYDLCVERALLKNDVSMELGFGKDRKWEASRFDKNENCGTDVYLYKLHGSIDWIRDKNKGHILTQCDTPQENSELIFGTTEKLRSIDPYLFHVHEFRKYSLQESLRLIVTVGYSFSDEYINGLIGQAIMSKTYAKLLIVNPSLSEATEIKRIAKLINVYQGKVVLETITAKEFFTRKMNLEYFEKISGNEDEAPF